MGLTTQGELAVVGINPLHLHAQMDHQEHGHVHHDTLHQQWKLVAAGEPAARNIGNGVKVNRKG